MKGVVSALACAALTAASATVGAPGASADAPPQVSTVTLDGTASATLANGAQVRQDVTASGLIRGSFTDDSDTVSFSGPRGTIFTLTRTTDPAGHRSGATSDPGAVDVAITMPGEKPANGDPSAILARNKATHASVIVSAMAAGDTYESAVAAFGNMDPGNIPTKEQALAALSSDSASTTSGAAMPAKEAPNSGLLPAVSYLDAACATINASGPTRFAHGCTTRSLDYANVGDWWISNKEVVSGYVHDWWYQMDEIETWTVYPSGNQWVAYNPSGTKPYSPCQAATVSTTDPETGTTVSETNTQCPDKLGPAWSNGALGYGGAWYGGTNDTMGAEAVGVVHNPPATSDSYTVHVYMHWS